MLATIFAVHFAILLLCEVNARPNFWETPESEFPRGLLENRAREDKPCDPKTGANCCKEDKLTTIKEYGKNCAQDFCTNLYEQCGNKPGDPNYDEDYSCTGKYKDYCVGSCPEVYPICKVKKPAAKKRCETENPGMACCEDGRVVEPDRTCMRKEPCTDVPGVCDDSNHKASACNSPFYLVRSFVQKMCPKKCNLCLQ